GHAVGDHVVDGRALPRPVDNLAELLLRRVARHAERHADALEPVAGLVVHAEGAAHVHVAGEGRLDRPELHLARPGHVDDRRRQAGGERVQQVLGRVGAGVGSQQDRRLARVDVEVLAACGVLAARGVEALDRRAVVGAVDPAVGRAELELRELRLRLSDTARRMSSPALVLHARQDQAIPYEEGRRLASLLPDARFVTLESDNHILQEGEPAWNVFLSEVRAFLGDDERVPPVAGDLSELSGRELDVLRLVAAGMSNEQIGERLFLSTRTVERHLSNIYAKLRLSGKSARAAAAARFSRT